MRRESLQGFACRGLCAVLLCASVATPAAADETHDRITGGRWTYDVAAGDTLRRIGARVGVDPAVLADANGLTPERPLRIGQHLEIDNRHIVPQASRDRRLVVNVPQRMLFFVDERGELTGFPVAVGRATWRTPLGPFRIVSRERNPSWEVPESIREEARRQGRRLPAVVPPGPANPLGQFWLGLSVGGVGIHGTNAPGSIYSTTSHGCIRLHPDDIAWLFEQVDVGSTGTIVSEPVLVAIVGDEIWLEAHRDVYGDRPVDARSQVRQRAVERGVADRIDWAAVDLTLRRRDGIARRIDLAANNFPSESE